MQNVATISKNMTRKNPAAIRTEIPAWRPFTLRFRRSVERVDWAGEHFLNQGLDSLCRYLLMAAFVCFLVPAVLTIMK